MSNGLYRRTLFPTERMFGLDSTQGYLEFADSSQGNKSQIAFCLDEEKNFSSHLYRLKQLEREKLIEARWSTKLTDKGKVYLVIEQMCLTTTGRERLDSLQRASRGGAIAAKIKSLIWTVITAVITTLVVLYVKGEL